MKHKALLVDDDPDVVDMVADVLDSIGHEHDVANHQAEARKFIEAGGYSYVLLDIEIPARGWHSRPRTQNSVNLLEQIRESDRMGDAPVIFMSDHVPKDSEVAVEMMRLATDLAEQKAVDYIHKPFPTSGRTLDRVIKKMLGLNGTPRRRKRRRKSSKVSKPKSVSEEKKDVQHNSAKANDKSDDESATAENSQSDAGLLTKSQRDILEALAKNPQETMLQVEIVVAGGYSKHVTQECLKRLRTLGLVHRPHGERKGEAITSKGIGFLEQA